MNLPGIYRAVVTRTDDPQARARIRVRVPSVNGGGEFEWALPCFPVGGEITLPPLGSPVWVMFEHGDRDHPVWLGTWRGLQVAPSGGLDG